MKPERKHIDYLQDIVNNLEKAERFVEVMDFEDFLADEKTRYSAIRALEIVGEAFKKVPHRSEGEILRCPGKIWQE